MQPRLAKIDETTPRNVGPGSYINKKKEASLKPRLGQNLQFGTDQRFRDDMKKIALPGPGMYNDQNKWNKRTYNLKFLNFQAHALNNALGDRNSLNPRHHTIDMSGGNRMMGGEDYASLTQPTNMQPMQPSMSQND